MADPMHLIADREADREAEQAAAAHGWTVADRLHLERQHGIGPTPDAVDVVGFRPVDGLGRWADGGAVADRLFRIWLGWLVTTNAHRPDVAELVAEAGDVARVTADGWLTVPTVADAVPGSASAWGDRFARWVEARPWVELRPMPADGGTDAG